MDMEAILKMCFFSLVGHCLRGVPSLIFVQHNNQQNAPNILDLVVK